MKKSVLLFNSIIVILLPLFFIACASTVRMYTGNVLPQDQIAIISNEGIGIRATVTSVDGKMAIEGRATVPSKLEVLPGEHTVTLQYYYHAAFPAGSEAAFVENYRFNFEPGKKYSVKYSLNEKDVKSKNAEEANTGIIKSSSSLVYQKAWESHPVWLWIEELKKEK